MTPLPDPTDIQVATGVPEVEAFRAASRRSRKADAEARRKRHRLDEARRVKGSTPLRQQYRARAYTEYRAAADAAFEAAGELHDAEKTAEHAAPDTMQRLRLSITAYSCRLRGEYETYGHRLYR